MIRALVLGGLAAVAGCAQLAGIDSTSGDHRTGDSLKLQRMSVGTTVTTTPLDLTGLSASYLVGTTDAPSRLAATSSAAGTWAADLDGPASVEFTLPDYPTPVPRLFTFPSQALQVLYAQLEHAGATPAPASPANIALTAPLDVATTGSETFSIYTLGSWTSRPLMGAEIPAAGALQIGPVTYDFTTSGSITGRPLDKLTTQDAYLVLRTIAGVLDGVAEATPFDQTGNDTVTTAKMTKVTADQPLNVAVMTSAITTRFATLRPAMMPGTPTWSVNAAPGYAIGSNAGPALASGMVTDAITAMYGNPFAARGWNAVLTVAASASRTFTLADKTTQVTLAAGIAQVLTPSASVTADLPAGFTLSVSFNGTPLVTDGTAIQAPPAGKFVEIKLTTDKPTATFYQVQVFDLLPSMGSNLLGYHPVYYAAGSGTTFELPPEVFQAGHYYTLRTVATVGGYPALATGDFTQRALPTSTAYVDSAVIQVTP